MIKVVEIISDTNIGGAGILLMNRLSYTDRSVFDVSVILPRQSKLVKRLNDLKIPFFEIDGCYDSSLDLSAIPKIFDILKRITPHIINAHGCLSARIAALMAKVPTRIYTRHCVYPTSKIYRFPLVRGLNGIINCILSNKIIAVAHSARDNLVKMGIPASRISVIINGAKALERLSGSERISFRKKLGIPKSATVVTICARLEKCKDHITFLQAAKILALRSENYRFLIVGGGSLEKFLRAYAKKLKIERSVIFTGFVNDVTPFMNVTDINVNCSVGTETSSLSISEGLSLGIPCVASDYGGNPYMVKNAANGYIFAQKNPYELAEKIIRLENSHIYKRVSICAKKRFFCELNANRMANDTDALYLSLVKKKRNGLI